MNEHDISIEKGSLEHLNDCEDALINSELGKKYFSSEGSAAKAVKEGLERGTLYIANVNGVCAGFVYYIPNGIFHSFPLLHLLAVKETFRGKGIGAKLLEFAESIIDKDKLFL